MAQVVVYGPNGARTTANTTFTEADKLLVLLNQNMID